MQELPDSVLSVILQFIMPFEQDVETIGILLVGSHVYGVVDPNSDVDIYIIQKEGKTRERGNRWIDGFEIEYFINPLNQVYDYLQTEQHFRPITAEMLSKAIILKGRDNSQIMKLLAKARKIVQTPLPQLSETELELIKYQLDDVEKDLLDTKDRKDFFAYNLIADQLVNLSIDTFLRCHNQRRLKTKMLMNQIRKLDAQVAVLLEKIVDSNYEVTSLRNLIDYVENLIGGKRTKDWTLKGPLTFES